MTQGSKGARKETWPVRADGDDSRPTIAPPFDPVAYARESERSLLAAEEPPTKPGTIDASLSALDSPREAPLVSEVRLAHPKMPAPSSVPTIAVAREDLEWFDLEEDARAVVMLIDGQATVETVLARSGDRARAMRALLGLAAHGVIDFR